MQYTLFSMQTKFTPSYLAKLESLLKESGYKLRYEKGNFKSGFCVLEASKVVVVNKFSSIDNKITFIQEIIRQVQIDEETLEEKSRQFLQELRQTEIKF
jgi:hypothetical protein